MSAGETGATGRRGRCIVVCGPSGVGKGTVVAALRLRRPELMVSVSATTRPPRRGEVDGRDYRFLTQDRFDALAAEGGFLEHATYAGRSYGTPLVSVLSRLDAGADVILEIEVQGARQVRRRLPEAVLILLAPPSPEALRARLEARGTEAPDEVRARLETARRELAAADEFDHVLVNDDLGEVVTELDRILAR